MKRESELVENEDWRQSICEAERQLHIGQRVSVRIAREENSAIVPLTWGWRRPTILLPASAEQWSPLKRRAVLLHELAHIARRDWLVLWLAQLVCVFYWFHPLVWWAARQLRAEGELATDDRVLAMGLRASEYAECLLEFMRSLAGVRQNAFVLTIGMAQASTLNGRVLAVLDDNRSRRSLSRFQIVGGLVGTSGLLLTLASLSLADDGNSPADTKSTVHSVTVKGRVLDEAGRPIANAKIETYEDGMFSRLLATSYSDGAGAYAVQVPASPDAYRVLQIEKSGFGVKVGIAGQENAKRKTDWTLVKPTALSGTVTDEDGAPISGALVEAIYFEEKRLFVGNVHGLETRTNAQGKWTLNRLPVGVTAEFNVLAPHFARQRFNALVESKATPYPAIKLQPGFDVTGKVIDVAGQSVAGAVVYLRSNGQARVTTDASGAFTLPGLTFSDQDMVVDSGRRDQFAPDEIRASPSKPSVQIQLHKGITIRGRILDAATHGPVVGVDVNDQMHWGDPSHSDAQGRFKVVLHSAENASLVVGHPTYQRPPVLFLTPDQLMRGDVGDIELKRGTIWRGKVRVNGKAPGERIWLNLHSPQGNAQLATDEEGNFQINSLPPGQYSWDKQVWEWQAASPLQISIPSPSGKPFLLDVNVARVPSVTAQGRILNQERRPLAYAKVTLKGQKTSYEAISRVDGTWACTDIPASENLAVERVEYDETIARNLAVPGRKINAQWYFPDVIVNEHASQTQIHVVDTNGKSAAGARVLVLWGKEVKFAQTDAQGIATFHLAPQQVRFLAAKSLNYGEVTLSTGKLAPVMIQLHATENLQNTRLRARALLTRPGTELFAVPYASKLLGDQRYRAFTLVADGAASDEAAVKAGKVDWNRVGDNFGAYLSELVISRPKFVLANAPIWLSHITLSETVKPFFLRTGESDVALLAARSNDVRAKSWASSWLDKQVASFNVAVALKPQWGNGDRVARYLQGYAVARELHRKEADRFFEAALKGLPEDAKNSQCYSYPQYFSLDDPNALVFRSRLVPEDQVSFQGVLSGNAVRADIATVAKARQALETLLRDPAMFAVESSTILFAHRMIESEVLRSQIETETPRTAFEKLKSFDSTNYDISSFALELLQRTLKNGDKPLGLEILKFSISKGWGQIDDGGEWRHLKALLLPQKTAPQVDEVRAESIAHLKNGDPMYGNFAPDMGADAIHLRAIDAALGRLILEAKWSRIQPLKVDPARDNRYDAAALAQAMALYDSAQALKWYQQIPAGGESDQTDAKLTLAAKIVGTA